jgi:hypothetical protein
VVGVVVPPFPDLVVKVVAVAVVPVVIVLEY